MSGGYDKAWEFDEDQRQALRRSLLGAHPRDYSETQRRNGQRRNMEDDKLLLPAPSRMAYALWWYRTQEVEEGFTNDPAIETSEDLGDFVEAMATLRTFGPNPKAFEPPITPEDVNEYYGEETVRE